MTPEAQRIAIAEACGWKFHPLTEHLYSPNEKAEAIMCWVRPGNDSWHTECVPDYLNDLDAMNEAVSIFDYDQADEFDDHLCDICKRANDLADNPAPWRFAVTNATAVQRAEAFLKTLKLWKP